MADLTLGTRGTCRHCGEIVVWQTLIIYPEFPWKNHPGWMHMRDIEPSVENYRALTDCLLEKIPEDQRPRYGGTKQAQPMEFCQDMTEESGICNRPVKYTRRGRFLCGIHSKAVVEKDDRADEIDARDELNIYIKNQLDEICEELKDFWDIEAHPEKNDNFSRYRPDSYEWTGYIAINPGKLMDLLKDRMEEF